jgi:hypothetical protein
MTFKCGRHKNGRRPGTRKAVRRRPLRRSALVAAAVVITAGAALSATEPWRTTSPGSTETRAVPSTAPATVAAPEPTLPPSSSATTPSRPTTKRVVPVVEVPREGLGQFTVAPLIGDNAERPATISYTVEVEDNLPFPADKVAATVERTLVDRRGWSAKTGSTFARVDTGGNTRILLATPATVDRLCAPLQTNGQVSCRNGDLVVLNALRWANGSPTYGEDVTDYRRYLINHEVGHRLGRDHESCPQPGARAPLMVQQTKGLQGCEKNPWP